MAIMLPALMGTVGGGLGYTYALFFVSSSDADNPNKDVGREHVFNMCMFAAVSVTVIFSISMAIIRSRPAIPPTYDPSA